MPRLTKEVKIGKESYEVIVHPDCQICNAKDENGKNLRLQIDKHLIDHTYNATLSMIKDLGISLSLSTVKAHGLKHSPYINEFRSKIKRATERAITKGVETFGEVFIDPDTILQTIVNIGGEKLKSGELKVDGKLLISAIAEQGRRKGQTTLTEVLDELNKSRFAIKGEVVEPKELESANEDE